MTPLDTASPARLSWWLAAFGLILIDIGALAMLWYNWNEPSEGPGFLRVGITVVLVPLAGLSLAFTVRKVFRDCRAHMASRNESQ
jgi:hypothetical protein